MRDEPEGYVPMVKVYLKDEQGMERALEMEDAHDVSAEA